MIVKEFRILPHNTQDDLDRINEKLAGAVKVETWTRRHSDFGDEVRIFAFYPDKGGEDG